MLAWEEVVGVKVDDKRSDKGSITNVWAKRATEEVREGMGGRRRRREEPSEILEVVVARLVPVVP